MTTKILALTSQNLLQLKTENNPLYKVWLAGANLNEFKQSLNMEDINGISIPLLCDEIRRRIIHITSKTKKLKKKNFGKISFLELSYITFGLIYIYKCQVQFLYDQVTRQAKVLLDIENKAWKGSINKRPSTLHGFSNEQSGSIKRRKITMDFELDFTFDLSENSVDQIDNERLAFMFRTSTVMKRNEITMQDVKDDEFMGQDNVDGDESDYDIQEIKRKERSTQPIVEKIRIISHPADQKNVLSCESGFEDSLPDNINYQLELNNDMKLHSENIDKLDNEKPVDATILNNAELVNIILSPVSPSDQRIARYTSKRARSSKHKIKSQIMDTNLQIQIDTRFDPDVIRCLDPFMDRTNKDVYIRPSLQSLFEKPTRELKFGQKRIFEVTLQDSKHKKITEETDLDLINDFLICNKQQSKQARQNETKLNTVLDYTLPIHNTEPSIHEPEPSIHEPEPSIHEPEPSIHEPEPSIHEPESSFHESESEHHPEFYQPAPEHLIDNIKPSKIYNCEDVYLSRDVMEVINLIGKFDAADQPCRTASQQLFLITNNRNRENWGAKGVLQKLFWMWKNNVHPISMNELMQSNKQKVAAALAFYTIMELNSPRVGLITIEKWPNSNKIYNIAMSSKLITLLKKM